MTCPYEDTIRRYYTIIGILPEAVGLIEIPPPDSPAGRKLYLEAQEEVLMQEVAIREQRLQEKRDQEQWEGRSSMRRCRPN